MFLLGAPGLFPPASDSRARDGLIVGRLLADPDARAQLRRNFHSLYLGPHERHHLTTTALREVLERAVWHGRLRILWLPPTTLMHAPTVPVAPSTVSLVAAKSLLPPAKPVVPPVVSVPETPVGKVEAALKKSLDHVGPELKRALDGFNTAEALQGIATFCLLIMAAQAAGVGAAAIDLVLLAYAYSLAGWAGLQAGYEFIAATIDATQAKLPSDIDRAGKRYAGAFIKLGEAFAAWLLARVQQKNVGSRASKVSTQESPALGRSTKNEMSNISPTENVTPKAVSESKPIIVTPKGVAITPEIAKLQGISPLVGNFKGIKGSNVEEVISRVPKDWEMLPQKQGMGIRFIDSNGVERLRIHGPSTLAPAGSNSAAGWTARIHGPNKEEFFDDLGNLVGRRANDGHIPLAGNPVLGN